MLRLKDLIFNVETAPLTVWLHLPPRSPLPRPTLSVDFEITTAKGAARLRPRLETEGFIFVDRLPLLDPGPALVVDVPLVDAASRTVSVMLYVYEHDPVRQVRLELAHRDIGVVEAILTGRVSPHLDAEHDVDLEVELRTVLRLERIIVVGAASPEVARQALADDPSLAAAAFWPNGDDPRHFVPPWGPA